MVVINHVRTDDSWRRNGLLSFLLSTLESGRGVRRVGIKSAKTREILSVIRKRGYRWHPDNDYIKKIYAPHEIIPIEDIPARMRKLVNWVRTKHYDPSEADDP